MTVAERVAKWRAKHARRLARKQKVGHRPFATEAELAELMFTDEDLARMFGG